MIGYIPYFIQERDSLSIDPNPRQNMEGFHISCFCESVEHAQRKAKYIWADIEGDSCCVFKEDVATSALHFVAIIEGEVTPDDEHYCQFEWKNIVDYIAVDQLPSIT